MEWAIALASDRGLVRQRNEDSVNTFTFSFQNMTIFCFAVADGVGGHKAGDKASFMAMEELQSFFSSTSMDAQSLAHAVQLAFSYINHKIYTKAQENRSLQGMGTTLAAAFAADELLVVGHVGDSRAYLNRQGLLTKLTNDHSLVNELIAQGGISFAEARIHPQRHVITRAIGTDPQVKIDIWQGELVENDVLVLCTDGLSDLVDDDEIIHVLEKNNCVQASVSEFLNIAQQRGAHDNVSVVVAQCFRKSGEEQ